jgi:hypothetical protein
MARGFIVRPLEQSQVDHRPSAAEPTLPEGAKGDVLLERTTKRMAPVFRQAIDDGRGLDFRASGPSYEIRFIVTPRGDSKNEVKEID